MGDLEQVLSFIDDEETINMARGFIRMPTISGNEGTGLVDYFCEFFRELDIPVRRYQVAEGRENFFCDLAGESGGPKVLFNGHQDTKWVSGMTIDPFTAEMHNGRIYGRGSCDMKGALAAILSAFKAIRKSGLLLKGTAGFFSDVDEESGGQFGINWALKEGYIHNYDMVVCCEPTSLDVALGNSGVLATSYVAKGRSAHSGLAHKGRNAIIDMTLFIQEFLRLPYLQVENPLFGRSTVNFERIEGGLYIAAVPDYCRAWLDTRLIPETPPERVRSEAAGLLKRLKEESGVAIVENYEPSEWRMQLGASKAQCITENEPVTRAAVRAYEAVTGKSARLTVLTGSTFAGVAIEAGIPAIIMGPGSIEQAHTEDEWIEASQIPQAARLYAAMMVDLLGPGG